MSPYVFRGRELLFEKDTGYEAYLSREEISVKDDGASFRQFSLYLNDEELMDILVRENENSPWRIENMESI